jgi:hypothetical protein
MSPRHFDPDDRDQRSAPADRAIRELERYAMTADADAPRGLADRVMTAIEHEPAPRRGGFLAWLTAPSATGGAGRFVRIGAVAATLVLAVAGALFAGRLADLVRDVGDGPSPTPSVSPLPSDTPSALPSPSVSETPSPSGTPEASDDHGGSGAEETAQPTAQPTPDGTPEDTPEETGTPRPSATASPTATPEP